MLALIRAGDVLGSVDAAQAQASFTESTFEVGVNEYRRTPSPVAERNHQLRVATLTNPIPFSAFRDFSIREYGMPGIAAFDYDRDGDTDFYVSNGPGTANSLYQNQIVETGVLYFLDVAQQAGVAATDHDSSAVCYGDIDNDRDSDLLVVGRNEQFRLFENLGNGSFQDIASQAGLVSRQDGGSSCAFADVNADGLLDVVVLRTWNQVTGSGCFDTFPVEAQATELFINRGDGRYVERAAAAGLHDLGPVPPVTNQISHSVAIFDYDLDADVDMLIAQDQCAAPAAKSGGVDRGLVQVYRNDGSGRFSNVTATSGTAIRGHYMGFAVSDFNHDRSFDFFVTSVGDYQLPLLGDDTYELGDRPSRWFLGTPSGTFLAPGVGSSVAAPFGWAASAGDYDNDGDDDIIYFGGLLTPVFVDRSNPGVYLQNDGQAQFDYLPEVFGLTHARRNVHGQAIADLNHDGFMDLITVANLDVPQETPMIPFAAAGVAWGSVFDNISAFAPLMRSVGEDAWQWTGAVNDPGTLSVELNDAATGNQWVKLDVVGSVALTRHARINRDGIGAVVTVTPRGGEPLMRPVTGGSTYLSQNEKTLSFGLGSKPSALVDVMWPGGVRNRLYDVRHGERVTLPEIPCSYDSRWHNLGDFTHCVQRALNDLRRAHVIDRKFETRLLHSAIRAFKEERRIW